MAPNRLATQGRGSIFPRLPGKFLPSQVLELLTKDMIAKLGQKTNFSVVPRQTKPQATACGLPLRLMDRRISLTGAVFR
jgi:hypothetical protein